jgi:hypothetical protein
MSMREKKSEQGIKARRRVRGRRLNHWADMFRSRFNERAAHEGSDKA